MIGNAGDLFQEAASKFTGAIFAKLQVASTTGSALASIDPEGTMELEFILEVSVRGSRGPLPRHFILHEFHFCSSALLAEKRNRLEHYHQDISSFYRAHIFSRRDLAEREHDLKASAG